MKQLKKVYNNYFPFKGYKAITVLIWMFIRNEYKDSIYWWEEVHEHIHFSQERELGYILFYIIYMLEYVIKFLFLWNFKKTYYSISFEQEAYNYQYEINYLQERKHYTWLRYLFKNNNYKF